MVRGPFKPRRTDSDHHLLSCPIPSPFRRIECWPGDQCSGSFLWLRKTRLQTSFGFFWLPASCCAPLGMEWPLPGLSPGPCTALDLCVTTDQPSLPWSRQEVRRLHLPEHGRNPGRGHGNTVPCALHFVADERLACLRQIQLPNLQPRNEDLSPGLPSLAPSVMVQ